MTALHRWLRAARFCVVEGAAGVVSMIALIVGLATLPLALLFGGWIAAPKVIQGLRWWAGEAQVRAERLFGAEPRPRRWSTSPETTFGELRRLLALPSTRRDLLWLCLHAFLGPVALLVAVVLPLAAVNAVLVPAYWWALPVSDPVVSPYPVTSWARAAAMPLVAVMWAALAWWLVPWIARGLGRLAVALLAPSREALLAERLTAVSASRAAALDAHAAELRRIERDLHDGAQNKLVGVVMMLGIAERSLSADPASALPQLRRAQEAANDALSGLRTIVHDIYPPILDELGLDGALSALAGRSAVPCTLDTELLGRVPTAVESAAYFVVSESLTNVVKHSNASSVSVRVRFEAADETLHIAITDDGRGGASERAGGGLAGIRRRAEAFEGEMTVTSPMGGPTRIEVVLPCGS